MQIRALIEALMSFDVLRARQWIADAMRMPISWSEVARPTGMDAEQPTVGAGVIELLAERAGQRSSSWTGEVGESPRRIQWIADAMRMPISWSEVARPTGMDAEQLTVGAGVIELLAERAGQRSPSWTGEVGESPRRIYLVRAAKTMPRLR